MFASPDPTTALTPPPSPPTGYVVVRFLVRPVACAVADVIPAAGFPGDAAAVSFANRGGAAGGVGKRAGKSWKTAGAVAARAAASLPADLLAFVADLDARGIAPQVVAVAVLADRVDVDDPRPTRVVCRWPGNTASGWSGWEADEYVSACPNPTIRHHSGARACVMDNAGPGGGRRAG